MNKTLHETWKLREIEKTHFSHREFHKDSRRPQGDQEIPHDVSSIGPSGRSEKEMLVISRGKGYEYEKDLSDPGYQFERLVTSEEPLSNRCAFTLFTQLNLQLL